MPIHQEIMFSATPDRVYELFTDSEKFAAASGGRPANIELADGAAFSVFGGFVQGRQIELVQNERIVQAWRFSDWAPGIYSIVRLTLTPWGMGTKLELDQDAIPEGSSPTHPTWQDHIAANWAVYYYEPFKAYLANSANSIAA